MGGSSSFNKTNHSTDDLLEKPKQMDNAEATSQPECSS